MSLHLFRQCHLISFAALKEEAGSPMSSVVSVSDPNDLDVSMEMAKPEEEWMDIQSWTLCGYSALDDRRAEFDRFESTLSKVEGDLDFDQRYGSHAPRRCSAVHCSHC